MHIPELGIREVATTGKHQVCQVVLEQVRNAIFRPLYYLVKILGVQSYFIEILVVEDKWCVIHNNMEQKAINSTSEAEIKLHSAHCLNTIANSINASCVLSEVRICWASTGNKSTSTRTSPLIKGR